MKSILTHAQKTSLEFLQRAAGAERKLEMLEDEIAMAQAHMIMPGHGTDSTGGAPGYRNDQNDIGLIALEELVDSLQGQRVEFAELRAQAFEAVMGLEDDHETGVLYWRFLAEPRIRFSDIAAKLCYSERAVYDIYDSALSNLYTLVPKEYRQRPLMGLR